MIGRPALTGKHRSSVNLTAALLRILAIAACLMAGLASPCLAQGWYGSWGGAVEASKRTGMPLIAVFEQEGCPDCARMNSALRSGRVQGALRNAIKVRVEYGSARSIAERYNIRATPTLLLFSPDSGFGDCLFREEGSMSVSELMRLGKSVDSLAAKASPKASPPETKQEPAKLAADKPGDAATAAKPEPKRARSGKTRTPLRVSRVELPASPYDAGQWSDGQASQAQAQPSPAPGTRVVHYFY